jgi:hypothetical protein
MLMGPAPKPPEEVAPDETIAALIAISLVLCAIVVPLVIHTAYHDRDEARKDEQRRCEQAAFYRAATQRLGDRPIPTGTPAGCEQLNERGG